MKGISQLYNYLFLSLATPLLRERIFVLSYGELYYQVQHFSKIKVYTDLLQNNIATP